MRRHGVVRHELSATVGSTSRGFVWRLVLRRPFPPLMGRQLSGGAHGLLITAAGAVVLRSVQFDRHSLHGGGAALLVYARHDWAFASPFETVLGQHLGVGRFAQVRS